jgi:hypothetical protein
VTYLLDPGPYRYVLKRGMRGTDVAALQLNLPAVAVDGTFGAETEKAVKGKQRRAGLTVDGICGLMTQQAICVDLSQKAATGAKLPVGMLKSLMANESGFALGAFSRHPSDWGYDLGAYQLSIGPSGASATQENFVRGYTVQVMAAATATSIRVQHDGFGSPVKSRYLTDLAGDDRDRFAWQLAANNHNWPFASQQIYRTGHIFANPAADDSPADWVLAASAGRLTTPREWVYAYIGAATKYVRW